MLPSKSVLTFIALLPMTVGLGGCAYVDRLKTIGQRPALSAIEDPTSAKGYRSVSLPMPYTQISEKNHNSLWESGSNAFFKDNRARQVGDILTVAIAISDKAALSSSTNRSRSGADSESINNLGGVEQKISSLLPSSANLASLINTNGASNSSGSGSIERTDSLETNITAIITQTLPNGNFVIEGRQEVRINYEVRELIIAGVIRPQDIDSNNTINAAKIAEARISYGGRGVVSDVQQPRYGQQVLDILLPF